MLAESFLIIAVFSPLIGFGASLPFYKNHALCRMVTCAFMGLAFGAFIGILFTYTPGYKIDIELLTWIKIDKLRLSWGLYLDALSLVMVGVVIIISLLVHIYSLGYMAHDSAQGRFMSYLSLFTFMMLMLVTAPHMLQLFFGWEGVGLASYLLIGFWYEKPRAPLAGFKAFIVNRVGDVGLMVSLCALFVIFGSLEFNTIFMELPEHSQTTFDFFGYPLKAVDLIGLSLLIGAMGKSAQFGLHTWLPDAMEGPTPVSALIHAATMVTAGIFLVVRMSPLMDMSPLTRYVMVMVGTLTALYGATVALTQSDIKKIIAYSTCSQLGFMLIACGCGSYAAALFHLTTHAFFKALLFLGAGSVIHAMSDEQNIYHMGGLYKHIPYTYGFMWVGSLAIAGIPFLAGYFSKEAIMESIYQSGYTWAFGLALLVAMLTAFYSWRLLLLVFHEQPKGDEQLMAHVHESPTLMLAPLCVLSLGAVLGGVVGYQWFMLQEWGFHWGSIIPLDHEVSYTPALVKNLPTLAAALGIGLAFVIYRKVPHIAQRLSRTWLYRFLFHKWFMDELYSAIIVTPYTKLSRFLAIKGEHHTIDRYGPNGLAHIALGLGRTLKGGQSGYLYHYASLMCLGLILFIGFALLVSYKPWLKAFLRLP